MRVEEQSGQSCGKYQNVRGRGRKGSQGKSGQRGRGQDLVAELGEHFKKWVIIMPDASEGLVV